jgi:hypothetical protein
LRLSLFLVILEPLELTLTFGSILQLTGGCSSTAYYHRFIGRAAALSQIRRIVSVAAVFLTAADVQTSFPKLYGFFGVLTFPRSDIPIFAFALRRIL